MPATGEGTTAELPSLWPMGQGLFFLRGGWRGIKEAANQMTREFLAPALRRVDRNCTGPAHPDRPIWHPAGGELLGRTTLQLDNLLHSSGELFGWLVWNRIRHHSVSLDSQSHGSTTSFAPSSPTPQWTTNIIDEHTWR